jgi:hypothetical protein
VVRRRRIEAVVRRNGRRMIGISDGGCLFVNVCVGSVLVVEVVMNIVGNESEPHVALYTAGYSLRQFATVSLD